MIWRLQVRTAEFLKMDAVLIARAERPNLRQSVVDVRAQPPVRKGHRHVTVRFVRLAKDLIHCAHGGMDGVHRDNEQHLEDQPVRKTISFAATSAECNQPLQQAWRVPHLRQREKASLLRVPRFPPTPQPFP